MPGDFNSQALRSRIDVDTPKGGFRTARTLRWNQLGLLFYGGRIFTSERTDTSDRTAAGGQYGQSNPNPNRLLWRAMRLNYPATPARVPQPLDVIVSSTESGI